MTIYTVHEPPGQAAPDGGLTRIAFVKEGFCWPALFFPPIWLIFRRLWTVLLLYILLGVLIGVASRSVPSIGAVAPLFALWFALEANQLRRWTLDRAGWRFIGIAVGRDRIEAEEQFFRQFLSAGRQAMPVAGSSQPSAGVGPQPRPTFVANPGPAA